MGDNVKRYKGSRGATAGGYKGKITPIFVGYRGSKLQEIIITDSHFKKYIKV